MTDSETVQLPKTKKPLTKIFMIVGAALGALIALMLSMSLKPNQQEAAPETATPTAGETAFNGHYGYMIHLPKNYAAIQGFKDAKKTIEVVHFCKIGTDPTNFLNEGLYGQLGIVRLEVQPSVFAGNINGLERMTGILTQRNQELEEKFTIKNLQIDSLRGIQITYKGPFPRLETYILGHKVLYYFASGQDDEIYRDIVTSLRETSSEI